MPTSADLARPRPVRRAAAASGFTLLEVMVTLAVVTGAIVAMLGEREKVWIMALRTSNMMKAATYADEVLAEHLLDPGDVKEWPGVVEHDPVFHYEITLETYDLSTGRVESDEQADGSTADTGFSTTSAFAPPDALEDAAAVAEEEYDNPHRVRRYRILVRYPGHGEDGEEEEEYVLEGYAPVAREQPPPGVPP